MIKTFDFDYIKKTISQLELYNLKDKHMGLAISGGEDSCVLLDHFIKIKKKVDINFSVVHVHHGLSGDKTTNDFRNHACEFVKKLCIENGIGFYTNAVIENSDSSEEKLREIRHSFFKKLKELDKIQIIITAHHRLDLLETRLIRLLRGSGAQGLESMQIYDEEFYRPMLDWDKDFIRKYIQEENLQALKDPSNSDTKYFRNWIREVLFAQMQDYRPGSVESLARSLELIVEKIKQDSLPNITTPQGIDRAKLLLLSKSEQRSVLANYLKNLGVQAYAHTHIDEVLKRLDSSQKNITFKVLGLKWVANPNCIAASKDEVKSLD